MTRAFAVFVMAAPLAFGACERGTGGGAHDARVPAGVRQASDSTAGDIVVSADMPGVKVAEVSARTVPEYLTVAGRIQADPARIVRVFPPASGRLVTMTVRLGDRVRAGQTLAILESSDVASARADLQKARIDNERAEHAFTRASVLYENQVLAEKEYQDAKADVETSRSEVARTLQRVRMLGADPDGESDRVDLKAPRGGVVIDVASAPGELSRSLDNASPICTLADLGTVWAVGDVYEQDLAAFVPRAQATVTANAYPGEEWRGVVSSISDTIDPTTRTLKLRLALPNDDHRLKPEMFVTICVLRSSASRIILPSTAVVHDGNKAWVLVRRTGERFRRRDVVLGHTFDNGVEIASGLRTGEVVVVEGASLLRPGTA